MGDMTAAHFIFIPSVLLVGIIIGWILGSRAAHDALAAEMRRREERARRKSSRARNPKLQIPNPKEQSRIPNRESRIANPAFTSSSCE
jgi:hypothetical protein